MSDVKSSLAVKGLDTNKSHRNNEMSEFMSLYTPLYYVVHIKRMKHTIQIPCVNVSFHNSFFSSTNVVNPFTARLDFTSDTIFYPQQFSPRD